MARALHLAKMPRAADLRERLYHHHITHPNVDPELLLRISKQVRDLLSTSTPTRLTHEINFCDLTYNPTVVQTLYALSCELRRLGYTTEIDFRSPISMSIGWEDPF